MSTKKYKVIAFKNMPNRLPILSTITLWLLLDRLKAEGWVWGCAGTVMGLLWVVSIIAVFTQEQTEIL